MSRVWSLKSIQNEHLHVRAVFPDFVGLKADHNEHIRTSREELTSNEHLHKQGEGGYGDYRYFRCSSFTEALSGLPSRSTVTSTVSPTLLRRSASVKS
jgi:hypothetical protein